MGEELGVSGRDRSREPFLAARRTGSRTQFRDLLDLVHQPQAAQRVAAQIEKIVLRPDGTRS